MSDSDDQGPAIAPNRRWVDENAGQTMRLEYPRGTYEITIEEVDDD